MDALLVKPPNKTAYLPSPCPHAAATPEAKAHRTLYVYRYNFVAMEINYRTTEDTTIWTLATDDTAVAWLPVWTDNGEIAHIRTSQF